MKRVKIYTSTRNFDLKLETKEIFSLNSKMEFNLVKIYENLTYQTIEGFGGALTEASGFVFSQLNTSNQNFIIKSYFDEADGNNYNLVRIPIGSCDFSLDSYSHLTEDNKFSIERDKKYLIPLIKCVLDHSPDIKIIASPWSPPAFMKENKERKYGGKLLKNYYKPWAEYIVKFIKSYEVEGIPIWGITIQNEPMAKQIWDSCEFSADEEREFLVNHLYPALKKSGLGYIKIFIWDHNKERLYDRATEVLKDKRAFKYTYGVAYHWYTGEHFDNLKMFHERFREKILLGTEACQEAGISQDSWKVAERYIHNIIGDLNNFSSGWIDWNILLDERGGPNYAKNFCDAPIIANYLENKISLRKHYYAIGHFSRFIKQGAKRLGISTFNSRLEVTAFKNLDLSIVVVIFNPSDEKIDFNLAFGKGYIKIESLPHSVCTIVI